MAYSSSPIKSRKKNCHVFQLCYTELCDIHNTSMIFPIKAHLHKRILDFNGDRVKLDEWRPILKALSLDRSLHLIAIRSKNSCSKVLEHVDSETKCRSVVKRLPVLLTHFIFGKLVTSLSRCLHFNSHLKCLELDGLLLTGDYLQSLLAGLEKSSSLQHLSLHRCPLGDEGCQLVCTCLRNLPNILTVDMSGCNISEKGVHSIARTLQCQNLNRYGENWKQSLRYRTPDTDVMPGLRRVTLNHNPLIGDNGVIEIVKVLKDDLWLKALDLQNVGLTNKGGLEILNLLKVNKSLSVLDVHNNVQLDQPLYESIMNLLASNNLGKPSEYHWIREDTLYLPRKPLYQSRDPSTTQRSVKCQANSDPQIHGDKAVRLTKSNIIPDSRFVQVQLKKTHSASAVLPQSHIKVLDHKSTPKSLLSNQISGKQTTVPTNTMSNWEHINASGDGSYVHDLRAKLRELSSELEEERHRRIEAEKKNADLAFKLDSITKMRAGQILMDQNVVKEITEAFAAFNYFVTIFSRRGLPLRTGNNSEEMSDIGSLNSFSESVESDFESGIDGEPVDVKQFAHSFLPEDRYRKVEELPACASSCEAHTSKQDEQCNNSNDIKCESSVEIVTLHTVQKDVTPDDSAEKQFQKLFYGICQFDFPNFQLNDESNLPSNHQSNMSENCLEASSAVLAERENESCGDTDKARAFTLRVGSNESVYMNAEQTDRNDTEDSWVTEFCHSDPSPSLTLTDLNAD